MRVLVALALLFITLRAARGQGVTLLWQEQALPNNSLVDRNSINESTPLTCSTPLTLCCNEGAWILPNGTAVPEAVNVLTGNQSNETVTEAGNSSPYITRGNQAISLNWPNGTLVPSGIYSCSLPNGNNVTETLYVGVYPSTAPGNNGTLVVDSLSYDSITQSLTCIVSGGPVTMVTWWMDGSILNESSKFNFSQLIQDTEAATYVHTLKINDKSGTDSGLYQCRAGNSQGMVSRDLNLELCNESSLRLVGSYFDVVAQVCTEDVWRNALVGSSTPEPTGGGNEFPLLVSLQATGTILSVEWNGSNAESWYQVVCSYTSQSLTILEWGGNGVTINNALPDTNYSCCVSLLNNSSGVVYTYTSTACDSVSTPPALVLSHREIGLVAAGGALLLIAVTLLLVCGSCCCALCKSKRQQGQYELEMREQSNHYTKKNIKIMPLAHFPSNKHAPKDTTSVLCNQSALEMETLSPSSQSGHTKQARSPQRKPAHLDKPVATAKPPHSHKPSISKPEVSPSQTSKPRRSTPEPEDEQAIYANPDDMSPADKEEADNPIYGVSLHEEAENPMYGVTTHQDEEDEEAENPMYGVTTHQDEEDEEAENPMYGVVR